VVFDVMQVHFANNRPIISREKVATFDVLLGPLIAFALSPLARSTLGD